MEKKTNFIGPIGKRPAETQKELCIRIANAIFGIHTVKDVIDVEEMVPALDMALISIPQECMNCVIMHFGDGKSDAETAAATGMTETDAKNLAARGLRKLRHPSRSRPLAKYIIWYPTEETES